MQLYEETRRGSKPATSLISLDQKPSMAAARTGSSFLPAAGVTGGLVAPRAVGAVGAVGAHDLLGSAPAGGTMGIPIGERQFLYIQVCVIADATRTVTQVTKLNNEKVTLNVFISLKNLPQETLLRIIEFEKRFSRIRLYACMCVVHEQ